MRAGRCAICRREFRYRSPGRAAVTCPPDSGRACRTVHQREQAQVRLLRWARRFAAASLDPAAAEGSPSYTGRLPWAEEEEPSGVTMGFEP